MNEPIREVEADSSTVKSAAAKIESLMDGTPSVDTTHPEEPEVIEPVTETDPEEPEAAPTETPTEVEEPDVITQFSDIAEHLGVDEDYLESLIVPTKINGERRDTTIKDLVSSFQKGESGDLKLMELAEKSKQFNTEVANAKTQLQTEWERVQALESELQTMLEGQDDTELQELRHSDPAEYTARLAERQIRQQKAGELRKKLQEEGNQKLLNDYSNKIQTERTRLIESIPEWADDKIRETETMKVRKYLKSNGLQDFEIDGKIENGRLVHPGLVDSRFISMARDAMLFTEARKGTEPKKKKLKSLPKMGAGKPKNKADVDDVKKKEIRGRVRKSGKLEDAAMAIRQLMEN